MCMRTCSKHHADPSNAFDIRMFRLGDAEWRSFKSIVTWPWRWWQTEHICVRINICMSARAHSQTTKANTNNSNYKSILDLIALNEAKRVISEMKTVKSSRIIFIELKPNQWFNETMESFSNSNNNNNNFFNFPLLCFISFGFFLLICQWIAEAN